MCCGRGKITAIYLKASDNEKSVNVVLPQLLSDLLNSNFIWRCPAACIDHRVLLQFSCCNGNYVIVHQL